MATLVLGAVGSSIGGPAGGFGGALVGGVIDNFLLFPAVFPKPKIIGPRIDQVTISTGNEGDPIKWAAGPRNRVGGEIIWTSDLIEEEVDSGGGKGGGGPDTTNYVYSTHVAVSIVEVDGLPLGRIKRIKKIIAGTKVIYENGVSNRCTSITFYDGTQTTPDPLMESIEGTGAVPAYIGTAYLVIEKLNLGDFGNQLPNLSIIMEQDSSVSLGEALGYILERAGFDSSEYDVSRLPQCIRGIITPGPVSSASVVAQLLASYTTVIQELEGVITFIPRGAEDIVDIDEVDFAAHEDGGDSDRPFEITDTNALELPNEVIVQYLGLENDLQPAAERRKRSVAISENVVTIDSGVTMSAEEASALASVLLSVGEAERQKIKISLPPSYINLNPGDVLRFTYRGSTRYAYCNELNRGANFRVEVMGSFTDPSIFSQQGQSASDRDSSIYSPPHTFGAVMDLPALKNAHISSVGYYFSICTTEDDADWRSAFVYESPTISGTYVSMESIGRRAAMGRVRNIISPATTLMWDTQTVIEVEAEYGVFTSASDLEVLSGSNRVAVQTQTGEWEIIGFATAELLSSGRYRLSRLLRGQRGTEHLVDEHRVGSIIVLLTEQTVKAVDRGAGIIGSTRFFKFPAYGGELSRYDPTTATLRGYTTRPFSPTNLQGSWDTGTNDFTITWDRRSKYIASPFAMTNVLSPDETPETYKVEFRAGGYGAPVLRTVTTTSRSLVYTDAEQTADGLSAGATPISATVYQVSTISGPGTPATKFFNP